MNGFEWQQIWGPVGHVVFPCGGARGLFATEGAAVSPHGEIYAGGDQAGGIRWVRVGGPGKAFTAGPDDTGQPNIIGLSPDGSGVHRLAYEATPQGLTARWKQIGGPAGGIYAGEAGVFASNPVTGDLYAYDGTPMSWTRIGGPGKTFAVGKGLYGLTPDGSGVWQYGGMPMQWQQVGGPAGAIYVGADPFLTGDDTLVATNPDTGDLYLYDGTPMVWTHIGGPGKTFALDGSSIYGLSPNGASIWQYSGTPTHWLQIGGAAERLWAGPYQVCATQPGTDNLLSAQTRPEPPDITPIQLPGAVAPG